MITWSTEPFRIEGTVINILTKKGEIVTVGMKHLA